MRAGIYENILGLDVSMADALGMDVGDRAQQLVRVDLHKQVRDHLLHLQILFHHTVRRVGDVVHHHIQVYLVFLVTASVE